MMLRNLYYCAAIVLFCGFFSCSKEFLEVKPRKEQVIVETLTDVAALLDNASTVMNRTDYFRIISDGDLYCTDNKVRSLSQLQRNLYLWNTGIDPTGRNTATWDLPYRQIMYANVAMESLTAMAEAGEKKPLLNELFGRALFFRAWAHYHLLQDFAAGVDAGGQPQLGIPIIKDSKFPKVVSRAPIKEVYAAILKDLEQSEALLPTKSLYKTQPSKQAALALIARVYLNQHLYGQALEFSRKALDIDDSLVDYNTLSTEVALPLSAFNYNTNPEIIFFTSANSSFVNVSGVQASASLFSQYHDDDLRKSVFFNASRLFIGTYSGTSLHHFTGLAVDELYLIVAECLVRTAGSEDGLAMLEALLRKRYVANSFSDFQPMDKTAALDLVLTEKQKELVGRGVRWTELKRLNATGEYGIDVERHYNGDFYHLPANDPRYVFEIPQDEVLLSGLQQNIR